MNAMDLMTGLNNVRDKFVVSAGEFRQGQREVRALPKRKLWLIAAVIALALLLVGCAVAAYARIHMKLVQHNVPTTVQTDEGVPDATPARSVIASCYPQQLPEATVWQRVRPESHHPESCYRNDAGEMISFTISTSQAIEGVLAPPREETSFTVSGWDAVLQTSEKGAQTLSWHNEAEATMPACLRRMWQSI